MALSGPGGDGPHLQRLRALIQANEALSSTLDVEGVLQHILDLVTRELNAERSTIYVLDAEREELVSLIAQGLSRDASIRLRVGEGVAGHVAATGEIVTVSNAYTDTRFALRFDRDTGFRTSSMLAIPLNRGGKAMGVLQVLNRREGFFDQTDREYLLALGSLIAVAIENARLHEQELLRQRLEAEKEQMERELRTARAIQERFLPRSAPVVAGAEVAGLNVASEHVSGDYFDFGAGAEPGGAFPAGAMKRLPIVVADVSGHGIPAALLMSMVHAGLRSPPHAGSSPGARLTWLNELLYTSTDASHFATVFVGDLDPASLRLRYASGGHPLPLLLKHDGEVVWLAQGGIPAGMLPGFTYEDLEVVLEPGDLLLVYTDGVTEAFRDEVEFGEEGLVATVRAHREEPAADIAAAVIRAVIDYGGGGNPEDDVTVIAVRIR